MSTRSGWDLLPDTPMIRALREWVDADDAEAQNKAGRAYCTEVAALTGDPTAGVRDGHAPGPDPRPQSRDAGDGLMMRPRKNPCPSCPFRKECPSGLWAAEEYDKLPAYDAPTWDQPPTVFMCHTGPDEACAGWVATFDMAQMLGLRIRVSIFGDVDIDAFLDYATDVAVFSSGAEAAEHGKREIEFPSERAAGAIEKIVRQRAATRRPIRYG